MAQEPSHQIQAMPQDSAVLQIKVDNGDRILQQRRTRPTGQIGIDSPLA